MLAREKINPCFYTRNMAINRAMRMKESVSRPGYSGSVTSACPAFNMSFALSNDISKAVISSSAYILCVSGVKNPAWWSGNDDDHFPVWWSVKEEGHLGSDMVVEEGHLGSAMVVDGFHQDEVYHTPEEENGESHSLLIESLSLIP